jgi:HK97 family phage major capsid protein
MSRVEAINARLLDISNEMEAISNVALEGEGSLSDEDNKQIDSLNAEFDNLELEKDRLEKIQAAKDKIAAAKLTPAAVAAVVEPEITPEDEPLIPAKVKNQKSLCFNSSEDAYRSGMWLAALGGNRQAKQFVASQNETTAGQGIETVPEPLSNALQNLLEEYGAARRLCRRVAMGALTWTVPKVIGHASISFPAEENPIADSQMLFEQVTLTAKKMAGLVKISSELVEDSIINIVDEVTRDLAYGMAQAEDNALFVGNSIYTGGIEGDANVLGETVIGVSSIALTDLTAVVAKLPNYSGIRREWCFNRSVFYGQVRDILNAAGGNAMVDIESGQRPSLFGFPVNLVEAIPGASANTSGDLLATFGDLSVSHYFGDRRNLSFRVLDQLYANNDQIGVQATQRIDIAPVNPEAVVKLTIA